MVKRDATPPLDARFSFVVHRINARIAQIANRLFARYGLNLYSSRILVLLLERRAQRVGELVEAMLLPQSTISHQLQRLEAAGYVSRTRVAGDNRSVSVALTERGEAVARECNELSLRVYETMMRGVTPADSDIVLAHLTGMLARLADFEGDAIKGADTAFRVPPATVSPARRR